LDNLRVLALNACTIQSWKVFERINHFLPNLEELYLANNDLSDLPLPEENTETTVYFTAGQLLDFLSF
jgi:predicted DNA-binding protein